MASESKLNAFIENPRASLWKLAIPMMIGLFVNSIYILVDTYFIGSKVGTAAISALGYVMPFYFIVMGITFGLSSGTTAVIAQYIGKDNRSQANQTAQNSIIIAFFMALINFLFIYFLGKDALILQGINLDVLNLALEYFYVMAYGSLFMIFGIFLRAILIGEGESLIPMSALGIGTIVNIILDPFFIDYWSIAGAAYATIVSQVLSVLVMSFFIIIRKTTYIDLSFSNFKLDFKIWKKILKIGIPSSISMLIMSIGLFIMNSILVDDAHVAGYNLANRIENFITLTLISISTSQVTILGMFYGAKRYDLLKSMVRYTTLWSIIISIFFSIISFFYIDDIAPFFLTATTPDEIEMSKKAILSTINYYRVMVFIYPFIAITMVSTRAMQAIGKAWPMMVVSFSRVILFQCTLSYIFITILDKEIMWAWYAIGVSCSLSAIIAYLMRVYFYKKISYIN